MAIARVIQVLMMCFPIWSAQNRPITSFRSISHPERSSAPDTIVTPRLPANISAPHDMYAIINKMLLRSATFRGQCEKIAKSRKIRVTLLLVPPNATRTYRAISRVVRDEDKNVRITIELTACTNYFELLGHEFEHAAEQAEGLNLRLRSAEKNSHVYRLYDGSYETDRAIEAGRIVARECASNKAMAAEGPAGTRVNQ